jgi:hypothetical protein
VKKVKNDLTKSRREFIKNSTLAGAGIAAAAIIPGTVVAGTKSEMPEDKKQKGYQLTDHIIEYYKSAAS